MDPSLSFCPPINPVSLVETTESQCTNIKSTMAEGGIEPEILHSSSGTLTKTESYTVCSYCPYSFIVH